MKKAKVKNGIIQHVWPWIKTLPDGTKVTKELPPQYRGLGGKPIPDCIIDVSDEVKPGWRWDGEKYAPIVKPAPKPRRDYFMELLLEKAGISDRYEDLMAEAKQRKRDALTKTD